MPEPFSLLEMPMTGGVDEHTDPRKVSAANVLRAENCRIVKAGRFDKRFGLASVTSTVLSGTSLSTTNTTMHGRGTAELLLAERSRLLSRASEQDRLVNVDKLPEIYATELPSAAVGGYTYNPDMATIASSKDYVCIVYGEPATADATAASIIYAEIRDAGSQTTIVGLTAFTAAVGYSPKVIAVADTFVVVWSEGANIKGRRIDMTASVPAWSAIQTLRNDHTGVNGVFDICTAQTAGTWILAYQTGAGANRVVSLYRYDNSATLVQQATGTTGDVQNADYQGIGVVNGSSVVGVAYSFRNATPNDVVRAAYQNQTTLANTTAAFNVAAIASPYAVICSFGTVTIVGVGTGFQVAWNAITPTGAIRRSDDYIRAEIITSGGAVTGVTKNFGSGTLASKLLSTNGTTYALVNANTQNSGASPPLTIGAGAVLDQNLVLCDFYGADSSDQGMPRPVTTVMPRVGSSMIHATGHVSQICIEPDTSVTGWRCCYGELQQAIKQTSALTFRIYTARLIFETQARQSCELGGLTYFSGGVPSWYDGTRVGEVGFLSAPNVTLTASAAGGSMPAGGVYQYAIVMVQYDDAGSVHRSIPWKGSVTLGGGDNRVIVDIPYVTATTRMDAQNGGAGITFEIYRTGNGTTQLRLLTERLANLYTSTGCLTYNDTNADTALANQPFLYDTATPDGRSQLQHVNPPSAQYCITHKDRVWLAGCPNSKEIWISSKLVQREAPFFSEAQRILVDEGGPITGFASMDDRLLIFKEDRIFYVAGDGPDDSGNNSDWTPPTKINGTVGCTDARSIVVTPTGIIFRSKVGLSFLNRKLEVDPGFGLPIEGSLGGHVIMSATVHKTLTEVRFLLDTGVELRYDYHHGAWLTAILPIPGLQGASRWVGSTLFYLVDTSLYSENTADYRDNGTFVPMLVELAPVSQGGRLGMQDIVEFQLLADRYTAHDLKIEFSADGDTYPAGEAKTWAAADLTTSEYVLSKKPLKASKGRIAKVRITDVTPSSGSVGTGQGCALVAASFKVAVKDGPYKLIAAAGKG